MCFSLTDIDECEKDNGGCEAKCTNHLGGYTCECEVKCLPGYVPDGNTCIGGFASYCQLQVSVFTFD